MKLFGHKNGKGGFTLAEMLMVIGILAILLAFAVPGVASYSKRIKLMELDDSARSIFMSAQNRLMALKSAGVTNLTFDKAKEIPLEEIYKEFLPEKEGEKEGEKVKKDISEINEKYIDFRYITSEDVKEIEGGKPNIIGVSDGGGAVNTSSIESQLYQNDFIIEYDARSGFVFGVFYSETAGALDFDNFNSKDIKRDFEDRLEHGGNIGYYGGGALVEIPDGIEQVKPIAGSSSKEKLAVSIDFPKDYPEDKVYFTVSITGYDYRAYTDPANKEKYKHTIAIISKDDRCYIERDKNCTIILDSIAPGKSADTYAPPYRDESKDYYGWWLPDQTRYKAVDGYNLSDWVMERDFKGWVYAGYFARKGWDTDGLDKNNGKLEDFYLLDSEGYFKHYVEHSTDYRYDSTDYRYGGDVKEWNRWGYVYPEGCAGYGCKGEEVGKEAINDGGHVTSQNPYVYYIIDPGSDITVEYSFYDASKAPDKDIHGDPLVFNSYFDKLENGIAYVSAGRHLQNLAFYTYCDLIKEVYITKTIDFSEDHTGLEDAYDYWNSAETNKGTERATNLYDFVPIDNKFVNPSTAPNILPDPNADSEIMIKYIRIDSTTYGKTDPNIVQTFTESNHDTTGFFTTTMNREMAGLTFYCPVVIGGGQYTGTVIGKPADNGVHLKNVTVINPIVEGPGYVGGICGGWSSPEFSNNKVLVEEVEDYFDNYNGGESLWRNARKKDLEEGKCEDITWGDPSNDPYSKFVVRGIGGASYAGGLIGCARDQVSKSSASVRVEGEGYAGGLIGLSSGITFSNNYVGGHTYNGQFAGVSDGGTRYVLKNIYGAKGAGGLIGKVDDGRTITLNGAYSTCSVASDDPNNADVMVGEGNYSAQNNSYAAGWVIDNDGNKIKKAPRCGDDLKPVKKPYDQVSFEPYDEYISQFYDTYPYTPQNTEHIGDWPIDPPIFGVFYWEKVGDDYKIKSIYYDVKEDEDKDDLSTLDPSLTSPSGEYGYGYFYTSTVESVNEKMLDGIGESKTTEAKIKEELENRLSVDLTVVMRKTSGSNDAHGLRTLSFVYDYAGRNGIKNFYFNPDFCGVSFSADLGAPKTEGEEAYHIRNVKQFNNITNSLGSSFVQDAHLTVSGAHNPIGDLSAYFTGKYNGSNKNITVSSVKTENLIGIGLFGVTRNAQIMNINLDYNGEDVSVSNKADRTGVGGVVGIAIGGSISDCKVTGFSVAANENDEIAIGGIAGYSSAEITNCNFGTLDAGSESFVVTSLSQKVNAVGGIAGSASGRIENCNTNSMKTELSAVDGLVLAGGIVGNNVDYVNGIHLEVTGCKSYASLTRPEVKTAVNTTYKSNVLIHPIAPTVLTVKTGDSKLYSSLAWLVPTSPEWKQKLSELLNGLGIPFSIYDENAPEYRIITGTGRIENSEAPDVKISKCTAKVGAEYYNSLIYGDISVDKETSSPTNDPSDVYVAVPPADAYYQTYVKVPPTVGIYSLYEHANGTLRAKPYLDSKVSVNDEPENNLYDPIDEYGILVSFGRIDDEKLNITVTLPGGATQKVNVPGTSYVGLDGNAISITDAYKRAYFDFSEATFKEPGRYTVTAEYEGTTTVYTFEIKTRAPYVGVYGVLDGETKDKIAGVYTDRKKVGEEALVMPFDPETNAFVGKYGIMLEHSINRPKTLNNGISVVLQVKDGATISLSDSDFTLIGTGIYKTSEGKTPTSYSKTFDYYELNKKAFAKVPEGSTFSLTVTSDTDVLATYEFKKEVRVPHLAVVAVKKEGSEARAVIKNPDSEAPVTVPENIGQDPVDILHFGILLEDGFNKENLKVELLGEDNSLLRTLEGTNIGNAAEYKLEGVNGTTGRINGVKYLRLSLPDKSMEKVHVIKLTYTDAVGNPHELSVSVAKDLKGNIREHQHSYDNNWKYIDDDKHGRYCVDDNCDNKDMSLQAQDHDIKYVVTQKPVGNQKGIRHKYCKICKQSWEDEEFEAAPYLGIYALYYKYELDENGKPKRDGDGYKLDESKKYAAAVIMSDVKEQFLIPDGTYGELTGEYGFLIDSAYDFYNGDKIRLRVGNIGGDRPIADRYPSDGPYEIIDGSGKTFADYNGRTINYYKINVGEINGDVSVGIKVWDEKANDYKSVIDIPKSTFENRPYNGCQHHSDSWEQTEEMHIGECDKCKEHVEEPHIFGEVREVTPAKPEQNGLIEHICSICEYALPEVVEYNSKPDINIIAVYDYNNKSNEHKIIGRAFINGKEVGYKPNDAWYDLNPSYYGLLIGKGVEFEKIEVILPDFGNEHYVHKIGISKADINSLSNAGDFIDYNLIRINYFDTSVEVHITYDGKEIYKGHIGDPFK